MDFWAVYNLALSNFRQTYTFIIIYMYTSSSTDTTVYYKCAPFNLEWESVGIRLDLLLLL